MSSIPSAKSKRGVIFKLCDPKANLWDRFKANSVKKKLLGTAASTTCKKKEFVAITYDPLKDIVSTHQFVGDTGKGSNSAVVHFKKDDENKKQVVSDG